MEVRALFARFVWRGVNIDDVTSIPRFKGQSHTAGVRTQPGRTRFTEQKSLMDWLFWWIIVMWHWSWDGYWRVVQKETQSEFYLLTVLAGIL